MSYILLEYSCGACGDTVESLERRSEVSAEQPCPCGGVLARCLSAPKVMTVWGAAVSQGKSDERPPGVRDTSKLAEGQKWSEFKAERKKDQQERRFKQLRAVL